MRASKTSERFVCYYRVSTLPQGASGLGLDAQRASVERYVKVAEGEIMAEFTETESGKKAHNRPKLLEALALCRKSRAVLLIAKLDRLARNVHFVSGLLESGVSFVAVDQPTTDKFMLHVQAAFAEEEARRISIRTKEALAAAKARGTELGKMGKVLAERHRRKAIERSQALAPAFKQAQAEGARTTAQFRDALNNAGVPSPYGARWHVPSVYSALKRLGVKLVRGQGPVWPSAA